MSVKAGQAQSYLLTTQGRKTGRPRTNPVVPVEHDGRRWLVAPYGPVSWVHNARAAGMVRLARRHHTRDYAIREAAPDEAGPVLKRYVRLPPSTRPYFQASRDSPVEDFVAEVLAAYLSAHRTMINGSALCAGLAVTKRD